MIKFELDADQERKAVAWMKEVDPFDENDPDEYMKHGAIGGAFTYTFTPTSIGTAVSLYFLKGTPKERMIDLSDYENW